MLFETQEMTKELLHALLMFRVLELRNEYDRARIERRSAFACLGDALSAEAALILKIVWIDLGHTI
jgi:hypothetical protein